MRTPVRVVEFAAALAVTDITPSRAGQAREQRVERVAAANKPDQEETDYGEGLALEDAGYDPQPPEQPLRRHASAPS